MVRVLELNIGYWYGSFFFLVLLKLRFINECGVLVVGGRNFEKNK